jgi:acetyl esterase/lipase
MMIRMHIPSETEDQAVLRFLLRTGLRVLFRGLIRPPVPLALQRAVLRLLTCCLPQARGVRLERAMLAELPCDDVLRAYQALLDSGYAPSQIVIAGDSAGGNLSLITGLRLRELGLPQPAAYVCFSPVTDFTGTHLHTPLAGDPLIHPAWVAQALASYVPAGLARDNPALSPVFADCRGLAPLLIQVGEDEVLLNDSLRMAQQAQADGVDVVLQRFPDLWHVFQAQAGVLRAADRALADVAVFLRSRVRAS